MENLILQKRNMVQSRIEKSFESGLQISELQCIEKAYSVGQSHPKHPDWLWTDLGNGKFDWKSKNGKWWKGKTGNVATPAPASKPAAQKKFDADVTEHVDELVKKIGKDKALERFERYVKEYGDDGTKFGAMMKYKYSQAAEYLKGKAESDFKKTFKDARDEVLQQVVSGKIQASSDERKWAKDLLDERKATEDAAKGKNVSDEIFDKLSEAFWNKKTKLEDFKSMVDKSLGSGSFDSIWKEVNSRQHSSSKETDNDFLSTLQNRIYASSASVDSKQDKAAQNAGFKDYKEMKAWQDYGTAKQLLKKELKRRGKPDKQKIADLKEEIATYEKNHADVIAAHDGGKKKTESYASMDIKDAKKALVGKTVTLTDYWPDGRGGSQDAIGEIKNVRLYGKNKTPIAEVVYPNGDEQDIRLDEIDDGKMKDSYKTPITIGDNKTTQKSKPTTQKSKPIAKTFAGKIMERAKDGRWFGSLSDDEKKKLEDNIKNDKASINDLLLAKFPAATAYPGFSSKEESKIQLANGKMLKLVHSASIQSNRMGQEYTKHDYQITDLYGKVMYGSSQSSQGYTTPAQAKQQAINQALYSLFAKKSLQINYV